VEHPMIEPRPVFNRLNAGGLQPGNVDRHHGDFCGRPPLAGAWRFCRLRAMLDSVTSMQEVVAWWYRGSSDPCRRQFRLRQFWPDAISGLAKPGPTGCFEHQDG
jgi:hypothetical protein